MGVFFSTPIPLFDRNLPPGISLEESAETAARIRQQLVRQSPEIKMVMSQSGRNDSGMDPFGPNRNEFLIEPHPYSMWPRGKTKRELVQELAERLNTQIPGATFNITQPIIDTSTEIATGSSADLAVISRDLISRCFVAWRARRWT
jgi:heavy metal efflux system protein